MTIPAWIAFSVAAAFFQTLRFMGQRHLKVTALSTAGATFARFAYAAPLAMAGVLAYAFASGQALPIPGARFWAFALMGGLAQILATSCVVALFARRNFAVGIALKKTEVIQTALIGLLVLGDAVSLAGAAAITLGFFGVLLLTDPPKGGLGLTRLADPAAALGLVSGLLFALSAVGYRGATLAVVTDDTVLRAGWTLALVTLGQSLGMGLWLRLRAPGQLASVAAAWRLAGPMGVASLLGSFCWFAAFAQQSAAYVFAVGQVELIFSLAASVLVFRERVTAREVAGMAVLTFSILAIVMVG